MIKQLKIKNFALAKDLEINFQKGFNVLIGETGAGKSIILKSLIFLLGEKFNKSDIRTGENLVKVSGIFDNISEKTRRVLQKFDIETSDELLISRSADASGKGDYRINGEIATLPMIKELAETLVDFYGQHDNQLLLKTANHIDVLDSFRPQALASFKEQLSLLMTEYRAVKAELDKLGGDSANRTRLLDLLDYQIKEIKQINPQIGEDIEIEARINSIRNYEKIASGISQTVESLSGYNSATESIKNAIKSLNSITQYSPELAEVAEKLNGYYYDIFDIAESLNNNSKESFSEYELENLDERLDKIKNLKKKYGSTIEEVVQFLEKAETDKQNLENADEETEKLTIKLNEITQKLTATSERLSEVRKNMAMELEEKMAKEFAYLGMKNAKLKVEFNRSNAFSSNGIDNVEFLFSANLGEKLKPLGKTISGGEMSRFMLALKNIIAEGDGVGTLIFDEIDAGISGEVGSAIAEKIAVLSQNYQVVCITHLPQVCAMADNYFYISKKTENNSTFTISQNIVGNDVLIAISRLSGGQYNTEISLAHARELKYWAENFKNSL